MDRLLKRWLSDTLLTAAHKFFAFMKGEEETPDAPKLKAAG